MTRARLAAVPLPAIALALCFAASCATVKRFTPDLSNVPMPDFTVLKKVTRIIPGLPHSDTATEEDPKVPFNARGTLGYGHTLRIEVYEGARIGKRIYEGVVMIDSKGGLDFGETGTARVGGADLPRAADTIAATFRVGRRVTRPLTVHILSVEDLPVVAVTGDVQKDEYIPAWDDMTIAQAVKVAGGRKLGSTNHGVYLTREGRKRYFTTLEAADREEPEPGDIITLSPDL